LDLAHVPERLQGGEPGDGDSRGLLEAEVGWLGRELVLWRAGVLGEGAVTPAEHLITRLEPGHLAADRLHTPGDVHAQNGGLGFPQPEGWDNNADQIGQPGHDIPVAPMQASRLDLHQYLVAAGHRPVDVCKLQDIGGAVPVWTMARIVVSRPVTGLCPRAAITGGHRGGPSSHPVHPCWCSLLDREMARRSCGVSS